MISPFFALLLTVSCMAAQSDTLDKLKQNHEQTVKEGFSSIMRQSPKPGFTDQLIQERDKELTVFLFYSRSVPEKLVYSFSRRIKKIKADNPDFDINPYVLFYGFPAPFENFEGMKDFMAKMSDRGVDPSISFKVHPFAFKHFGLDRVPAFALSYCPADFRFKECENLYLAKGDLPLEEFFAAIKEENDNIDLPTF